VSVSRRQEEPGAPPRVLIVGAGFGGLNAARELAGKPVDVILVDKNNHHTFLPLLYQVAAAGLEPEAIAEPVRGILRRAGNVRFRMTEVKDVDLERRVIIAEDGELAYDYLVLAAGSATNYFGSDEIEAETLPMKELVDAAVLRSHILSMFETAVLADDEQKRRKLMTVVVVGGGATGVELSGALAELRRHVLPRDFPELNLPSQARVILLEAMDALLPGFPPKLQRKARDALLQLGVEVRLNSPVETVVDGEVRLRDGASIQAATVVWVAGVRSSLLADCLGEELGRGGRVPVRRTLQTRDRPEVYVIGDMASLEEKGRPLPMVAPVAIQQGRHVGQNLVRQIAGQPLRDFRYRDRGSLATIGRRQAVAHIGPLKLGGLIAWVVWLAVHLFWLIGFRNRILVLVGWAWNYVLYEPGARLITRSLRRPGQEARQEAIGGGVTKL
jgi:NADH:ubiquinone reductase (H+-translocating)